MECPVLVSHALYVYIYIYICVCALCGKGLGRIWGGFGEVLGRVWERFWEGLGRVWVGLIGNNVFPDWKNRVFLKGCPMGHRSPRGPATPCALAMSRLCVSRRRFCGPSRAASGGAYPPQENGAPVVFLLPPRSLYTHIFFWGRLGGVLTQVVGRPAPYQVNATPIQ